MRACSAESIAMVVVQMGGPARRAAMTRCEEALTGGAAAGRGDAVEEGGVGLPQRGGVAEDEVRRRRCPVGGGGVQVRRGGVWARSVGEEREVEEAVELRRRRKHTG
jgi:hypothetical protein